MKFTKKQLIQATDQKVQEILSTGIHSDADQLFQSGLQTTLQENLFIQNNQIFLQTGDIPAMWLRDSAFQAIPFVKFAQPNNIFEQFVRELIKSQLQYIRIDPYANAFNIIANNHHFARDESNGGINPSVWERKFELDSLCAPLFLSQQLFEATGDIIQFDNSYWDTIRTILTVLKTEQNHENSDYYFRRLTESITDTLPNNGYGSSIAYTGMVWSGFRPSDDPCRYGYLVPANMFAVSVLDFLRSILFKGLGPTDLILPINDLLRTIKAGIENFGQVRHEGALIYAYEVDGNGHTLCIDDANLPNLLAAPLLGFKAPWPKVMYTTQKFILSQNNPFYFNGKFFSGLGSSHTPVNFVWPIALATEGLLASDRTTKHELLDKIIQITGKYHCHESINVNDLSAYTRNSFSWADMMYCWLYLDILEQEKGTENNG